MDIKEWYCETYSTDELKNHINEGVTFLDLKETLRQGDGVYDLLGVHDSLIRERLFHGLAAHENVEVSKIYDLYERGIILKEWSDITTE